MAKKIGPIEKTLRAAKAWLDSPDRLVTNWNYMAQDKYGKPVLIDDAKRLHTDICRACLMGAVYAAAPFADAKVTHAFIYQRRSKTVQHYFCRPRSFREAHAFYDRAIADAHRQGV